MKRLISLLLAMVLLISVLPIGVFAAENPVELESLQTSRVNPLYDDLGIELEELSTERVAELDHATKYHTSARAQPRTREKIKVKRRENPAHLNPALVSAPSA